MGPRQLYDVTSRGACMLRKASPFFAGLDPFAWTGSASIQCKWHPVCISCMTQPCLSLSLSLSVSVSVSLYLSVSLARSLSLCLPPSLSLSVSHVTALFTPQGLAKGAAVRGYRATQEKTGTDSLLSSPLLSSPLLSSPLLSSPLLSSSPPLLSPIASLSCSAI